MLGSVSIDHLIKIAANSSLLQHLITTQRVGLVQWSKTIHTLHWSKINHQIFQWMLKFALYAQRLSLLREKWKDMDNLMLQSKVIPVEEQLKQVRNALQGVVL